MKIREFQKQWSMHRDACYVGAGVNNYRHPDEVKRHASGAPCLQIFFHWTNLFFYEANPMLLKALILGVRAPCADQQCTEFPLKNRLDSACIKCEFTVSKSLCMATLASLHGCITQVNRQ